MEKQKTLRRKAKLRATPVSKIEAKPWRCSKCLKRVGTKTALVSHWKKHSALPPPDEFKPTAGKGKELDKKFFRSKKKTKKETLKEGRERDRGLLLAFEILRLCVKV